MDIYTVSLTKGITRTKEFERKRLAEFAVNVGTKCGHGCRYCSTGAILRMHPSFRAVGRNPFMFDYAIVDPDTPERIARDARRTRKRGIVQVCSTTDAWSPEAHEYGLGRRSLEAILNESGWIVRLLTKNTAVRDDFDLIKEHRDRVLVGLSITAPPDKEQIISTIEPNASSIPDRMAAVETAHQLGLRTYAMFCPLLPGIADSPQQINELVRMAAKHGAEEIFVEPVNPRGPGLRLTQEALQAGGFEAEASAVEQIRRRTHWSEYVVALLRSTQYSVRKHAQLEALRFLLYPAQLSPEAIDEIRADDDGVIWLGSD